MDGDITRADGRCEDVNGIVDGVAEIFVKD